MKKRVFRRLVGCCLAIGGAILTYHEVIKLGKADLILGSVLAGIFFLVYVTPLILFGASIELREMGLHIQQYVDIEIPYSDIRACYRFFLPPFHLAIVITKRHFPLCLLIEGMEKEDSIVEDMRRKLRDSTSLT